MLQLPPRPRGQRTHNRTVGPITPELVVYVAFFVGLAYFFGYQVGKRTAIEDAAEELRRKNESGQN